MDVTKFNEKFNRVEGNIYTIEETINTTDGIYENELIHDNANLKSLNIYTGPKLTGNKINTYSTSTPSLTPWKTIIKIFSTEPQLYISYETTGDQVEAEDINNLQDAINMTQEELNKENNRATSRENNIEKDLNIEITRAKNAESTENTRAINRENLIEKNLDLEVERAKASEKVLTDNLNTEINRAKGAEKTISDNLSSEVNRATNVESTITNNLNKEIDRAKVKENSIESNFNNYKTSNDSEIQGLKAKDADLDNKKANLDYVNLELNKRYTKDQTFTREEVLKKIQDLIGTAPDTLDTFKEIADALGNDPNFATTIMNALAGKVDKINGKELSTNDYDNTEKTKLADVNAKKHEHSNKNVIDKITQGLLDAWNSAYNHISDSIRHITSSERNLWNTISDKANKSEIPSKLSQLINDKKFITQDDIDTSQNHIHNNKSVLDKINQQTLDDINLSTDKVLKNKLTPIETDSTLTKLSDCAGGYVRNMLLMGKTLQNVCGCGSKSLDKSPNIKVVLDNTLLKANTPYTFILDLGNVVGGNSSIFIRWEKSDKTPVYHTWVLQDCKNKVTSKVITFTEIPKNIVLELHVDNTSDTVVNVNSLLTLEGDWTNKEIPPYFEGIKSVGELEGNKISILSTGKNLINNNFNDWELTGENVEIDNNILKIVGELTKSKRALYKLKCRKITTYSLSIDVKGDNIVNGTTNQYKGVAISFYKGDKYLYEYGLGIDCGTYDWKNVKTTFTPKSNIEFDNIVFSAYLRDCSGTVFYKDIQLEEGTTVTSYENYKEDKTEILLPSPHMGLPNGVSDIVDFDKNERIKNVGKGVLDVTTQPRVIDTELTNCVRVCFNISSLDLIIRDNNIFSSFTSNTGGWWEADKECLYADVSIKNRIWIHILKSKLSTLDATGVTNFLKTKNVEFYYQLETPVVEKLNIKDTLQAFENGYIQLDNAITPFASLEYSTNLPSALSGVVEIQDKILDRVNILEKKKSITWDELEGV